LDSGIQEPTGGVARYYCSDIRENRPISTEITGYAVSTLVYLHTLTGDQDYLKAAISAGRFLTRTAWRAEDKTFPFELETRDGRRFEYFFDTGIIIRGLLHLWKATGQSEFRDVAAQAACGMAEHFAEHEPGYFPILELPSHEPLPLGATWSRMPGCYQLKSALAWDQIAGETQTEALRERFEKLLAQSLRSHDCFLPGAEGERVMDRLHAYCYFLEALMWRASRPECANAIRRGMAQVSQHLREIAPAFARSDVYAQLLRVRLWAETLGVELVDRLKAEEEAQALATFQLPELDVRIHGGFAFGVKSGQVVPHVNPVSTGFALQALTMWDQYRQGQPVTTPDAMI